MNILQIRSGISQWDYKRGMVPTFTFKLHIGGFGQDIVDDLSLTKIPYAPTKGDKIYFLPNVNVPRVKFKNVCVEHNVKNVRDFFQATVFFGSKKSLNEMTDTHWLYKCPTKYFVEFFELVKSRMDEYDVEKTETALEYYTEEFVALDSNLIQIINEEESIITDDDFGYSENLMTVKEEYQDLYNHLKGKVILDESCVINVLNGEDATEIDESMYNHLCEMFDSSDTDNHVLAMEIMANSKYVESLVYLELLFYKYYSAISDRHTKNHVNFKSLVSYLGKDKSYMSTDIDDIAKSLIDKDQFTTDKIDIVMSYLSDDIKLRGTSKYFAVKTITVHPDFAYVLNKNYEYEVQADFVPTVVESPEVGELPAYEGSEGPIGPQGHADPVGELGAPGVDGIESVESEFAAEDNFEEEVEWPVEEPVFTEEEDEAIGEAIAELEPESITVLSESKSNNNQIATNDPDDFEWF
jgi:hypothetical protein